ncbi:DUF4168 domain-containing protein [Brevundimonas sp. PAMC22021]|uniref:DUF4168 domain-containing protein n=1 Tax=Brevundimonas sp. PAMC22021 TaxID=2861285 RepID=UPI001C63622A|nr:DUF4168 domain-containing protein [Brevundimonas sp. PAMC22021]QYF86142.1 DUF4168 domain-containing protein [Brevundimonas sp. PAMC22021]
MRAQRIAAVLSLTALTASVAGATFAQDAAAPAPAQEATPAAAAAPAQAATGEFTDAELKSYGAALPRVRAVSQALNGGQPTPEQTAELQAAVAATGLATERFNAIAQAAANDPVLQARIAVAAAPASAAGSVGASVTEDELSKFAAANQRLGAIAQSLNGAQPSPEQATEMQGIVAASGLEVERFNAIGQAVSQDEGLRARIALAQARSQGAAPAPAPAPAQ